MADDKSAGGGGSTWEPFEIVLVILLAIGLLAHFQGGTTTKSTAPVKATIPLPTATGTMCGLNLARPHSLERVTSFVTLIGTTDGCAWLSSPDVALYAQVIDAYGRQVSVYTAVPAMHPGYGTVATFNTTIPLSGQPTKGTGFVILVPSPDAPDQSVNVRIPITFSPF